MNHYQLTDLAAADLLEIEDFIAKDDESTAVSFIERLITAMERAAEHPDIGRPRMDLMQGLRSISVQNYILFYRRIEVGIEIVRVLHGARDIESEFNT